MKTKKLLGSTLAAALLMPYASADAELLKNFKYGGDIETEMQASRNVLDFATRQAKDIPLATAGKTNNDRLNGAQTRVLLHLDWDMLDDVHAKVTLRKNDITYGGTVKSINGAAPNSAGAGQGNGSQSITASGAAGGVLGNIWVDQAYFKVSKIFGYLDGTVGRQFYGDPGDLIIYYGPQSQLYGLPVHALDSVRVDWAGETLNVTGIAAKEQGSALGAAPEFCPFAGCANNDVDIRGVKVGYKVMDGVSLDAHLYNKVTHGNNALGSDQPGGHNDNLYVYGIKGKYQNGGATVRLEFDKNNGENRASVYGNFPANFGAGGAGAPGANNGYLASEPVDAAYTGFAWKFDADYQGDIEGIASLMPWLTWAWGTGRGSTTENKNEGFYSINGDWRPGAIYGRFAPSGAIALGSQIQCLTGSVDCTGGGVAGAPGVLSGGGYRMNQGIEPALNPDGTFNPLNNRIIWGFGMKGTPAMLNQLTVSFDVWDYRFQRITHAFQDGLPFAQPFGTLPNGAGCNGLSGAPGPHCFAIGNGHGGNFKTIGDELDFKASWKHSDNLTISAGAGGFWPGRWIKSVMTDSVQGTVTPQVGISTVIMAWTDISLKF